MNRLYLTWRAKYHTVKLFNTQQILSGNAYGMQQNPFKLLVINFLAKVIKLHKNEIRKIEIIIFYDMQLLSFDGFTSGSYSTKCFRREINRIMLQNIWPMKMNQIFLGNHPKWQGCKEIHKYQAIRISVCLAFNCSASITVAQKSLSQIQNET